jgi:hypothetical protein
MIKEIKMEVPVKRGHAGLQTVLWRYQKNSRTGDPNVKPKLEMEEEALEVRLLNMLLEQMRVEMMFKRAKIKMISYKPC